MTWNRRDLLAMSLAAGSSALFSPAANAAPIVDAPDPGERPKQDPSVSVVHPMDRPIASLIIDDSTCLVNLAHFCIPQFGEVFPDRYRQDWRSMPREIPDDFVRKFVDFCDEHYVRGKYSIVPNPACVGWVDRDLPGWSRRQLLDSIKLVQERLTPSWDIHPEMITHTWVIDTKTGRPYPERTKAFMENWDWSVGKSPDELTDYLSYALRILKNAGFQCDGITTPGGFGNRARHSLSLASLRSCRDVYNAEIPHYFRHLYVDDRSVVPRVENASGIDGEDPQCVVSIIGCTGDWFGGWDGITIGSTEQFITKDLQSGRMVDVLDRGEPAIMVCHWPGFYCNGDEFGFDIFKTVVKRLKQRYDDIHWMKLSEISRYWAAKELTEISLEGNRIRFKAPYACPQFTISVEDRDNKSFQLHAGGQVQTLEPTRIGTMSAGRFVRDNERLTACFDLPRGVSEFHFL